MKSYVTQPWRSLVIWLNTEYLTVDKFEILKNAYYSVYSSLGSIKDVFVYCLYRDCINELK